MSGGYSSDAVEASVRRQEGEQCGTQTLDMTTWLSSIQKLYESDTHKAELIQKQSCVAILNLACAKRRIFFGFFL